jgi:hypothetical protein
MDNEQIDNYFREIGTHIRVRDRLNSPSGRRFRTRPFSIDILTNKRGRECFHLERRRPVEIEILDVQPDRRHLLLMVKSGDLTRKFLCGHDERHYFAAGVDEHARSVTDAMAKLQPEPVRRAAEALPRDERYSRANGAYKRQGEWFFVPTARVIDKRLALRDEPIRRGRSKPHICQYLVRSGGVNVMFHVQYAPNGIAEADYHKLSENKRKVSGWEHRVRDPEVYVKGAISHPDHSTLMLRGWHRVYVNAEVLSEELAFLD